MADKIPHISVGDASGAEHAGTGASSEMKSIPVWLWNALREFAVPEMKKVNEENAELKNRLMKMSMLIATKDLEIAEMKTMYETLQQQVSAAGAGATDVVSTSPESHCEDNRGRPPVIFPPNFSGDATPEWEEAMWNFAAEMFRGFEADEKKDTRIYHTAAPVYAFYHIIRDKAMTHYYKGSPADFVYTWNKNVAERLSPRQQKWYTCNYQSFKTSIGRGVWKKPRPTSGADSPWSRTPPTVTTPWRP